MAPPLPNVHVEIEIEATYQNQDAARAKVAAASITAAAATISATITSDVTALSGGKIVRTIELYIAPSERDAWGSADQQKAVIGGALVGPIAMQSVSTPNITNITLS